ncbi:putative transposase, Ptta/En/Spm, plant [Arabidopsis thaliana]
MSQMDEDGPQVSDNSSQHSTHRTLSIDEKNEIFLKCTHTDGKGNPFGLGSLVETLNKRRRKESYASSSTSTVAQLQSSCSSRYLNKRSKMQNVMRSIANLSLR